MRDLCVHSFCGRAEPVAAAGVALDELGAVQTGEADAQSIFGDAKDVCCGDECLHRHGPAA